MLDSNALQKDCLVTSIPIRGTDILKNYMPVPVLKFSVIWLRFQNFVRLKTVPVPVNRFTSKNKSSQLQCSAKRSHYVRCMICKRRRPMKNGGQFLGGLDQMTWCARIDARNRPNVKLPTNKVFSLMVSTASSERKIFQHLALFKPSCIIDCIP
uniref:Uncharacterized protein n=1 Tax=Romanomermis culicivorax TaxID=13658 RepID=A0A915JZS4_ROMCU